MNFNLLRATGGSLCLLLFHVFAHGQDWPEGFPQTPKQRQVLLNDWEFYYDGPDAGFYEAEPQKEDWEQVSIPHTLRLASTTLNDNPDDEYQTTFHRAIGWYRRSINLEMEAGQRVFLEFEGAHQVTSLWVNGQYVGIHDVGGYTPFHFDVTDFVNLKRKKQEIVLAVDNRLNPVVPPEGDRYDYVKWGGLYRDVYLVVKDPVHITFPWEETYAGVYITTPSVSAQDATISIRTQIQNTTDEPQTVQVVNRVIDKEGRVVLRLESDQLIPPHANRLFAQTGGLIHDLHLWSPEHPYLYRVNTTVFRNGEAVDVEENPLGLRKIDLVEGKGLLLNGEPIELIGVNRHQAMLFIGDAVPNSLQWKDAWQFKQMGINSVRLAHYPHDNAFIEACDELGLLLYEEPPTWIGIGNGKWMDNLEEATRRMVRNHRNNPSIVMWGAAINHRGPVERLHYACKEEDPGRLTASNGAPWTGPQTSGVTDVYAPMDYGNLPIGAGEFTYLCEHGSTVDATWHQDNVSKTREMPNMIGTAAWTAHDYQTFKPKVLGRRSRTFSIDRVVNPPFFWYQAEMLPEPILYLTDHMVGARDQVVVFSNCQEVALYHEGKLVARQPPDMRAKARYVSHPNFTFDFHWTGGELQAIGYNTGQEVAAHTRHFPQKATQLQLEIETDDRPFWANGSDIKTVNCYLLDERGTRVLDAESMVTFSVTGPGSLIKAAHIDANPRKPFYGVATAYLRSGERSGAVIVSATAPGLGTVSDTIQTQPFDYNRVRAEAGPIYDVKSERIDLSALMQQVQQGGVAAFEFGAHKADRISTEFLQFDWAAWTGADPSKELLTSDVFGCTYTLTSEQGMEWFTGWGQTGFLPYLAIDGVQVGVGGKLTLSISDLPAGTYELLSYHHSGKKLNRPPSDLSVMVSDALGADRVGGRPIAPSSGDLYNGHPASQRTRVVSNGTDPVKLVFDGGGKLPVPLNGFGLREVLEK